MPDDGSFKEFRAHAKCQLPVLQHFPSFLLSQLKVVCPLRSIAAIV